jgi:hypothetical protein
VLISGETGTGKELVARAIHDRSAQRDMPLIKVNCAAIPETLLESELFGHVRGAFTGAVSTRQGVFAQAHTGTLFIDEITELAPHLQAKLLRVIQTGEFTMVGGSQPQRPLQLPNGVRIGLPPLSPATGTRDADIRARLEMLLAVDESLGQLLETLKRLGELDNTVVVVAGDNGYFYGEHGLDEERRLAYEETARIPLLIRYFAHLNAMGVLECRDPILAAHQFMGMLREFSLWPWIILTMRRTSPLRWQHPARRLFFL